MRIRPGWSRRAKVAACTARAPRSLMCAVGGPVGASTAAQLSCARSLLEAGASIEAADSHGRTALMIAVRRVNLEATQLLLDWGADPNSCAYSSPAARAVLRLSMADTLCLCQSG